MPVYYLDASALVKYYIREPGTDFMISLLDDAAPEDEFFTSFLTVLEFSSAVLRRNDGDGFARSTASVILNRFDVDAGTLFMFWPLTHEFIADALAVVDEFRLRTGDTIHLTSAIKLASEITVSDDTYMVASDRELNAAASSAGLNTIDPQAHDSRSRLNQLRSPGQ